MSGLDERLIELVHADVDGELDRLTPADRAELARTLLANPEARALKDELVRLNAALARAESVEPPDDLRRAVLASVEVRTPVTGGGPAAGALLRYAAIFAGGALVTALGFMMFGGSAGTIDAARLVGTLVPADRAGAPLSTRNVVFSRAGMAATVTLHDLDPLVVLELDLTTESPLDVVAGFDPATLRLAGVSSLEDGVGSIDASGDRVTVRSTGTRRYAIVLRRTGARGARVHLEFKRGSTAVGRAEVDVPASS